ncbi:TadE/TadG family type IV pilus assembly protein [Kitasatospora phosalacinea]|uniref:TadE/TadG family type IV pilus assembly protein n=1 Tax=Kitasatospora phosalacinea TaxID=2065 RepID=A0ABW6GW97_9ACTN
MTLSLAIVFPAVLFVILLVVQAGLWWYAEQAALAAAREGVEAGRINGAPTGAGEERATEFVERLGDVVELGAPPRQTGSDPDLYQLSVTVEPLTLFPFADLAITKTATAPREKFVPPVVP